MVSFRQAIIFYVSIDACILPSKRPTIYEFPSIKCKRRSPSNQKRMITSAGSLVERHRNSMKPHGDRDDGLIFPTSITDWTSPGKRFIWHIVEVKCCMWNNYNCSNHLNHFTKPSLATHHRFTAKLGRRISINCDVNRFVSYYYIFITRLKL